ncbi:MAG: hypothetical protein SGPRY_010652 [Prymnesium sp.]
MRQFRRAWALRWALRCLRREAERFLVRLHERVRAGTVARLMVVNLGKADSQVQAEIHQAHIHAVVTKYALPSVDVLVINEWSWGSANNPAKGRQQSYERTGLHLVTKRVAGQMAKWMIVLQNEIVRPVIGNFWPGCERSNCHNFVAARRNISLKAVERDFYDGLPTYAKEGRFVCVRAQLHKHMRNEFFLVATWHGPRKGALEILPALCDHLKTKCEEVHGFRRLDPRAPRQRIRQGELKSFRDIDHILPDEDTQALDHDPIVVDIEYNRSTASRIDEC